MFTMLWENLHDWASKIPIKFHATNMTDNRGLFPGLSFILSTSKLFAWYCTTINNKCCFGWYVDHGDRRSLRPNKSLIYSFIYFYRASLYSKHPLAFSVEQRKLFEVKVFHSTWAFCAHYVPFPIYIPSMWMTPETKKKFNLYVFLHLQKMRWCLSIICYVCIVFDMNCDVDSDKSNCSLWIKKKNFKTLTNRFKKSSHWSGKTLQKK